MVKNMSDVDKNPGLFDGIKKALSGYKNANDDAGVHTAQQDVENSSQAYESAVESAASAADQTDQAEIDLNTKEAALGDAQKAAKKQRRSAVNGFATALCALPIHATQIVSNACLNTMKKYAKTTVVITAAAFTAPQLDTDAIQDNLKNLTGDYSKAFSNWKSENDNDVTVQIGSFGKMENAQAFAEQTTGGSFDVVKAQTSKGSFILAVVGETTCESAEAFMAINNQPTSCETLQSYAKNTIR